MKIVQNILLAILLCAINKLDAMVTETQILQAEKEQGITPLQKLVISAGFFNPIHKGMILALPLKGTFLSNFTAKSEGENIIIYEDSDQLISDTTRLLLILNQNDIGKLNKLLVMAKDGQFKAEIKPVVKLFNGKIFVIDVQKHITAQYYFVMHVFDATSTTQVSPALNQIAFYSPYNNDYSQIQGGKLKIDVEYTEAIKNQFVGSFIEIDVTPDLQQKLSNLITQYSQNQAQRTATTTEPVDFRETVTRTFGKYRITFTYDGRCMKVTPVYIKIFS